MEKEIIDLYLRYNEKKMDRREFMNRLVILAGGTAAAYSLLEVLDRKPALAAVVPEDDSRIRTEYVSYAGSTGDVRAYLARPGEDARRPAVMVVHENRGLNAHIEDVTRRLAVEGFVAMAPDALSPLGGTPADPDKAREMIGTLDSGKNIGNFVAAVEYLKNSSLSTGKVGVVGFCWGGAVANQVAVHSPSLTAAVPYYGKQPAAEEVPRIKASLLLHYAGNDERINKGIPGYEEALIKAGVDYRLYVYDGARHAFNNDTNPERYHQEAADLAWERTLAFLDEKLKP